MSTRLSLGKSTPAIRAIVPPRSPATRSLSFYSSMGWLGWPSLRASTEHSIRLGPEPINPECGVREHNGQPCRPAPLSCVRDARAREAFRSRFPSPLPLLVSGILTQDSDHTPTPDNPALRANRLYRRLHFHDPL